MIKRQGKDRGTAEGSRREEAGVYVEGRAEHGGSKE